MADDKQKRKRIFAKIENREDALKLIQDAAILFFLVAAIQGGIGFLVTPALIIDAVLIAIMAFILIKWKSRVAAAVLLIVACLMTVSTFLTRAGVSSEGGSNVILALIVFWAGVRATEATFKLHGKFAE